MMTFRFALLTASLALGLGIFVTWLFHGRGRWNRDRLGEFIFSAGATIFCFFFIGMWPSFFHYGLVARRTGFTNMLEEVRELHSKCLTGETCDRVALQATVKYGCYVVRGRIEDLGVGQCAIPPELVELSKRDSLVIQSPGPDHETPDTWLATPEGSFRLVGPASKYSLK